jgi:hypothetical protein
MLKNIFASCLFIFCAFFFLLTEFNEAAESANDPCRSASSDAEDIFADVDEFDIKVFIYVSQIVMIIFCRLCTYESCSCCSRQLWNCAFLTPSELYKLQSFSLCNILHSPYHFPFLDAGLS